MLKWRWATAHRVVESWTHTHTHTDIPVHGIEEDRLEGPPPVTSVSFTLTTQEGTSPTHRSKKWNYFDIVRYVYSFKSWDSNIWTPFFKEHNDGNYFFSHFFHIMVSHIIYLTTFLIRKDGDFIFRFLIHVDIWQNQYNIVKLKKKNSRKKNMKKKEKKMTGTHKKWNHSLKCELLVEERIF